MAAALARYHASSRSPALPSEFHTFPKLPPELCDRIWKLCLPDRRVVSLQLRLHMAVWFHLRPRKLRELICAVSAAGSALRGLSDS
jgi:hypothetical protein